MADDRRARRSRRLQRGEEQPAGLRQPGPTAPDGGGQAASGRPAQGRGRAATWPRAAGGEPQTATGDLDGELETARANTQAHAAAKQEPRHEASKPAAPSTVNDPLGNEPGAFRQTEAGRDVSKERAPEAKPAEPAKAYGPAPAQGSASLASHYEPTSRRLARPPRRLRLRQRRLRCLRPRRRPPTPQPQGYTDNSANAADDGNQKAARRPRRTFPRLSRSRPTCWLRRLFRIARPTRPADRRCRSPRRR